MKKLKNLNFNRILETQEERINLESIVWEILYLVWDFIKMLRQVVMKKNKKKIQKQIDKKINEIKKIENLNEEQFNKYNKRKH